jgi:hypothetical protein
MQRLPARCYIATSLFLMTVAVAADSKPNLSGTWNMNIQKSDAGSEIKSLSTQSSTKTRN